jgi:hypothetical protein
LERARSAVVAARARTDEEIRRQFIALLGGAAAWPLAARAQQADRTYRLGFLTQVGRNTPGIVAFFDELRAHGFVEGGNLSMIPGGFGVAIERIGEVAETMVKAAPDAIVAGPELPLRALQTLTRTIPLIGMTEDMVAEGFAASLARPGGNITGISLLSPELDGKRQDILIEAVLSPYFMAWKRPPLIPSLCPASRAAVGSPTAPPCRGWMAAALGFAVCAI